MAGNPAMVAYTALRTKDVLSEYERSGDVLQRRGNEQLDLIFQAKPGQTV